MAVCLQIMHALKMHKGVNELCLLSNTLTYQSCVLFLHKRGFLTVSGAILKLENNESRWRKHV